jgi:hypothetical protein
MSEVVDITELIRLKQRIVVLDRYLAERDKPDKPRPPKATIIELTAWRNVHTRYGLTGHRVLIGRQWCRDCKRGIDLKQSSGRLTCLNIPSEMGESGRRRDKKP